MGGIRRSIVQGAEMKLCYAGEGNAGYLAGTSGWTDILINMKNTIIAASLLIIPTQLYKVPCLLFLFLSTKIDLYI